MRSEIGIYLKEKQLMWNFHKSAASGPSSEGDARESQKGSRNPWIWIERLLMVFGIALLAFYGLARIEGFLRSRALLCEFALQDSSATALSRNGGGETDSYEQKSTPPWDIDQPEVDFSLWDEHRVHAYEETSSKHSGAPLGVLRISKLGLEAPLLEGTDDLTLNHAVGRIGGTARPGEPGNIGIAGHRDSFFRGLKDIGIGDAIELQTLEGTDTYVVDRIQIVTPGHVEVLQPRAAPSLTLVTCYPFYFIGSAPKRYIVTASLSRERKAGRESDTRFQDRQFDEEKK
jgi:sortase A